MRDVQFVSRHRGIFDEWDAAAAGASATVSRELSGVLCVEPYTALWASGRPNTATVEKLSAKRRIRHDLQRMRFSLNCLAANPLPRRVKNSEA